MNELMIEEINTVLIKKWTKKPKNGEINGIFCAC